MSNKKELEGQLHNLLDDIFFQLEMSEQLLKQGEVEEALLILDDSYIKFEEMSSIIGKVDIRNFPEIQSKFNMALDLMSNLNFTLDESKKRLIEESNKNLLEIKKSMKILNKYQLSLTE